MQLQREHAAKAAEAERAKEEELRLIAERERLEREAREAAENEGLDEAKRRLEVLEFDFTF